MTLGSAAESIAAAEALRAAMPLPLGVSLPPGNAHALSVSMPAWEHVIGYEEGRPEVLEAMVCGYPRFFRHPLVRRLVAHLKATLDAYRALGDGWELLVLPTAASAARLVAFLTATSTTSTTTSDAGPSPTHVTVHGDLVHVVLLPATLTETANRFWQHTGEIVSSRHAEALLRRLEGRDEEPSAPIHVRGTATHTALQERIASLYFPDAGAHARDVFVYPSGMAAIFAALRLLTHFDRTQRPGPSRPAVLFGFPYIDSLKMLERAPWCPGGVRFFPVADAAALAEVEAMFTADPANPPLAIFTEFPSNPLLSLPDLERLAGLAHAHGTYLVVDDTIASYNANPLRHGTADLVCTSLAKIFSGTCDAQAGSLVLNPAGAAYEQFSAHLLTTQDTFLSEMDARVLHAASGDLRERIARVNASASAIVQRLKAHPLVRSIYYPELDANVERFRRYVDDDRASMEASAPAYGPLLSIVLHGGEPVARAFYDALHVAKGPSLGTNFTLVCPYTLLAHYGELAFAESCGVDRHLVRISIGLEDPAALWRILEDALTAAAARTPDAQPSPVSATAAAAAAVPVATDANPALRL